MSSASARYQTTRRLGTGSRGHAHAVDTTTGEPVVLKELTLGRVTDWKQLELFQREARTLGQLDHPDVPRLVDSFEEPDANGDPRFFLVRTFVEGDTLHDGLGTRFETAEAVQELARKILGVLVYLQSFSPPVLHRDLKPENIILRPDGGVSLVDFGTVAVTLQGTTGGSTVVGTSGYMAPEQLMGRAVPASDLYALGATLVHVITATHPADLPMERMRLQWRDRARCGSDRLLDFVEALIEPIVSKRPQDAKAALRLLGGSDRRMALTKPSTSIRAARPRDTSIALQRSDARLQIDFGTQRANGPRPLFLAGMTLVMCAPMILVGYLINSPALMLGFGGLTLLFLIGSGVTYMIAKRQKTPTLELDADRGFRVRSKETQFALKAGSLEQVIGPDRGVGPQASCLALVTRGATYQLSNACSEAEQEWLIDEIADFLREHRR